jgi:hypothetical protein
MAAEFGNKIPAAREWLGCVANQEGNGTGISRSDFKCCLDAIAGKDALLQVAGNQF